MEFHQSSECSGWRWQGPDIEIALLPRVGYSTREPTSHFSLGFSFEHQVGVHAIASDRRVDFDRLPGSVVALAPGVEMFSESPIGGEYLVVRYGGAEAKALPNAPGVRRGCSAKLWRYARSIRAELIGSSPSADLLYELAVSYLTEATTGPLQDVEAEQVILTGLDMIYAEMVEEGFQISSIADDLGLTPVRFLRGFRRVTGTTPVDFVREARVQHARALMDGHGAMALSEIALASGFTHQSHMGEAFQRVLGLTPGGWRRASSQPGRHPSRTYKAGPRNTRCF